MFTNLYSWLALVLILQLILTDFVPFDPLSLEKMCKDQILQSLVQNLQQMSSIHFDFVNCTRQLTYHPYLAGGECLFVRCTPLKYLTEVGTRREEVHDWIFWRGFSKLVVTMAIW